MKSDVKLFDVPSKKLNKGVVVRLRRNPFDKENGTQVARVKRVTVGDDAIVTEMEQHTDCMRRNDIVTAVSAFVDAVRAILGNGNAVHISGLGTFYLSCPGVVDKDCTDKSGLGAMQIGFQMDREIDEVLKETVVAAVQISDPAPRVEEVTDMHTQDEGEMTQGAWAELSGKRMRIAGSEEEGCGLFIVPVDENGGYRRNGTDWIRVADGEIHGNAPGTVMFRVPRGMAVSKCRIAIRTRAPTRGAATDEMLLKKSRFGVSEKVFEVYNGAADTHL